MSKKRFSLLIIVSFTLILASSCGKDNYNEGPLSKNEGTVELMLSTVNRTTDVKSDENNLDVNNYSIEIYNSSGVRIKKWEKYSQLKDAKIRLNVGTYKMKAYYGDSTATGFDAVYFAGTTNFTVEGQISKQLSITCKMANVKVKVKWGEPLISLYSDYNVKIFRSDINDTLLFTKGELRNGYIPAGTLKFKIFLKDKNGVERIYLAKPLLCSPNDFVTITINSPEDPIYEISAKFSINTETDDIDKEYTIPGFMRPKKGPSVSTNLVDNSKPLEFIEGIGANAKFNIVSQGGIESAIMKITSPSLIARGWPSELDFATITPDVANILKRDGAIWTPDMQYKKEAYIDLSGVSKKITSSEGSYIDQFSIVVKDIYGQVSEDTKIGMKVAKPVIAILPLNSYDIWSKFAYISVSANVPLDSLSVEGDNGNGWTNYKYSVTTKSGNTFNLKVLDLKPTSTYKLRINYRACNFTTDFVNGSTEDAQPLKNGDMEKWSDKKIYGGNGSYSGSISCDYVEDWNTRNERTTNGATEASAFSNYGVNWRWCSGTVSTTDKTEGSKAAEISTLAFYNKGVKGSWSRDQVYSYTKDNGTAYVGYLFTGTFNKDTDTYTLGIAHNSRPISISFDYKYKPCTGGDKCLAYAKLYDAMGNEIASTEDFNSIDQATYVNKSLIFNYSNTKVKGAKIVVFFQSGYKTDIANMERVSGSYNMSPYVRDRVVGSVLKVDNIVLNY